MPVVGHTRAWKDASGHASNASESCPNCCAAEIIRVVTSIRQSRKPLPYPVTRKRLLAHRGYAAAYSN